LAFFYKCFNIVVSLGPGNPHLSISTQQRLTSGGLSLEVSRILREVRSQQTCFKDVGSKWKLEQFFAWGRIHFFKS